MKNLSRSTLGLAALVLVVVVVVGVLVLRGFAEDDAGTVAGPLPGTSAAAAMLTAEDLGGDYTPGDDEATSYLDQASGCLAALRPLTDAAGVPTRVVRVFRGPVTEPASVVSTLVSSYGSGDEAATALSTFRDATSGCTGVKPAKGRVGFQGRVRVEDRAPAGTDGQVRLSADGSLVDRDGRGTPLGLWVSVTRVGQNLTVVRLVEVPNAARAEAAASGAARLDSLTAAAVARLVDAA